MKSLTGLTIAETFDHIFFAERTAVDPASIEVSILVAPTKARQPSANKVQRKVLETLVGKGHCINFRITRFHKLRNPLAFCLRCFACVLHNCADGTKDSPITILDSDDDELETEWFVRWN